MCEGPTAASRHAVIARDILGNQGAHQSAITACALALNTDPETEAWLDWLFESTPAGQLSPEGTSTPRGASFRD